MNGLLFVCTPMEVADIPAVMVLEQLSFPTPWSPLTYRSELLDNQFSHYWVLRPGPGLAAIAADVPILAYGGYWLLEQDAHIVTIATHPEWRRQHLGQWLLLELLGDARRGGADSVTLEVRIGNSSAIALYAKLGFVRVGRRRRYYANGEDALLMTLTDLAQDRVWAHLQAMQETMGLDLCIGHG